MLFYLFFLNYFQFISTENHDELKKGLMTDMYTEDENTTGTIEKILHKIYIESNLELTAHEVFSILSFRSEESCKFRSEVADAVIHYFFNNKNSMQKIFLVYFQTFSDEYLSKFKAAKNVQSNKLVRYFKKSFCRLVNHEQYGQYLKELINETIEKQEFSNLNEIRKFLSAYIRRNRNLPGSESFQSKYFELCYSYFQNFIKSLVQKNLKYDKKNKELTFDPNISQEKRTSTDLDRHDDLFSQKFSSFQIFLPFDSQKFQDYYRLLWTLADNNIKVVTIVFDPTVYFKMDINDKFTVGYIRIIDKLIEQCDKKKIRVRYYHFDFYFNEKGKIYRTNFDKKMFECWPITILSSFDFRSVVQRLNWDLAEDQEMGSKKSIFLTYSNAMLDHMSDLFHEKENIQIPNHTESEDCHKNHRFMRFRSEYDEARNYFAFSTENSETAFNFIYIQNWQGKPNFRVNPIPDSEACFISITKNYFCFLNCKSTKFKLNLLK